MNVKISIMLLVIWLFIVFVNVHSVEGLDHGCPGSCSCFDNFTAVKCVNQFGLDLKNLPSYTQELYIARDFIGPIVNHTFNHLLQLEVLDMANNGISYIQGGVFRWLRQLRVLNLRKNYLNILDDSIFEDNVQIEYLDLSHNQFTELPRTAFRYLVNVKVLNVSYNYLMSAYLNSRFQVMTHIRVFDLSGNNLDVINGSDFEIARKWDLHVPKVLNFSHCSLTYIDPQALRYVGNVHFLGLANNPDLNISEVNIYLEVMHEINVKIIDISNTNLSVKLGMTNLDMSLLGTLALEDLRLAGNGFQTLNPTALSFLNLRRLDLSYNLLHELPNFHSMSSLAFLDVSHNSLTSVAGAVKDSVGNLEILIMSHNQLTDSSGLDLGNAVKLTTLDLSFNSFTSYNIPKTLKKLTWFSVAWNSIQGISVLEGLESLLYLDCSHNKLTKLDSFLFLDSQKLISANFSRNQISSISHQTFLPHTPQIIDLSWNELAQIRHFGWVDNVRGLHFEGNKISKIDIQAFYGLHSLDYLNLGYNMLAWFDSNVFQYLTNLTKLHLNRNFISEVIPLEELFSPLESLEILDLSNNNFTTFNFHSSPVTSCPSLRKLYLAGNDIKIFNPDSFQRLEYLEILDFSENPLHCSCDILPFRDWLMKTKVKILEPTSRSYVCHSPGYRTGKWLKNFMIRPFECQEYLLYTVLVFSTGGGLVVIGIIIGLVCHFWRKWRKKRQEIKEGPVISYKHQNGYHNPLYDIEDPYRNCSVPADIIIQETEEKSTKEQNEKKKLKKQKHSQKRRHSDTNGFSQKMKAVHFHDNRGYRRYEPSTESSLENELEHKYHMKKGRKRKQSRGNRELVRMLSSKAIRSRSMPDVINYVNSLPLPNRSRYPIIPIVHIDHPDSLRRGWVQSYIDLSERQRASPNHLKARYSLGNEYTDRSMREYHIPSWTTLPRYRISKKPYIPVNGYKVIPHRAGFDAAALTLGRLVERRIPRSKSQWI